MQLDQFLEDCLTPFSDCWCERRPNHPHCQDVENVTLENSLMIAFIEVGILILIRKKL